MTINQETMSQPQRTQFQTRREYRTDQVHIGLFRSKQRSKSDLALSRNMSNALHVCLMTAEMP